MPGRGEKAEPAPAHPEAVARGVNEAPASEPEPAGARSVYKTHSRRKRPAPSTVHRSGGVWLRPPIHMQPEPSMPHGNSRETSATNFQRGHSRRVRSSKVLRKP